MVQMQSLIGHCSMPYSTPQAEPLGFLCTTVVALVWGSHSIPVW
ncbi:Uncharacterised protein [Vibrio cholerae]|uniref:Uncharacterized protein n=1 Tax=Vibrio cholerae TaxID=666 RepID=A0A656AEM5_VIBCL|nr:Uncharacterised protein [Vibrio cholerae]